MFLKKIREEAILHLLQDYIHTSVQQPIRINKRSGGIVRVDLGDSSASSAAFMKLS